MSAPQLDEKEGLLVLRRRVKSKFSGLTFLRLPIDYKATKSRESLTSMTETTTSRVEELFDDVNLKS